MRRLGTFVIVALVLTAGCADQRADRPVVDGRGAVDPQTDTPSLPGDADAPSDPDGDVRGWEAGRWYNESLPVDATDGLDDGEREALVARAMARVERIREIEFDRPIDVSRVSRSAYGDRVPGQNDPGSESGSGGRSGAEAASSAALATQVRYEALFLLSPDRDAGGAESSNDAQTVGGYYDVSKDRIVLVSDAETPTVDEVTLSQELYHAYQFRHLVPARLPPGSTADTRRAWLSVVEGDANLVDALYEDRCEGEWDCLRPAVGNRTGTDTADGAGGTDLDLGVFLLQYFPYAAGERYVRSVRVRSGWNGVNALYDDMPASTEQVIHGDGTVPDGPTVRDRSAPAWDPVRTRTGGAVRTVGEAGIASMFGYTLYDGREGSLVARGEFLVKSDSAGAPAGLTYRVDAAEGWNGDALVAYRRDDGTTGYVWTLRFDTSADVEAFTRRYRRLLAYHGAERVDTDDDEVYRIDDGPFADAYELHVEKGDLTVEVVNAPTVDDLTRLAPE
jgi:hypothetical protein